MVPDVEVPDDAGAVEDEDRGAGDPAALRFVDVPNPVAVDDREIGIAENGVRKPGLGDGVASRGGWLGRDRDHVRPKSEDGLVGVPQLPELPPAGCSPVPAVEDEEHLLSGVGAETVAVAIAIG